MLKTPLNVEQTTLNQISEKVIGCAYKVSSTLGCGFLEKVYENALAHELTKCGLKHNQQERVLARYASIIVGDFLVDLIVEGSVVLEIKALREIGPAHESQLVNYPKATRLRLGLLLSFGKPSVQIVRRVNGF